MKFGIQLYNFRRFLAEDFEGTMQKIAQLGFEGVEVVVYRQKESKNYVINVTNATLPVLTLADISISVRIPENIKALYFAPDKETPAYTRDGDYVTIHLDKLHTFKMIIAEVQ